MLIICYNDMGDHPDAYNVVKGGVGAAWPIQNYFNKTQPCFILKELCHKLYPNSKSENWPQNGVKHENNHLKHWRKVKITQQITKKA